MNFTASALHLQQQLNKIMPNEPFDEEEVREMLFDAVFTKIDDDMLDTIFSGKDQELLEQGQLSEADILVLIESKLPDFQQIIAQLSEEIIEEYKEV